MGCGGLITKSKTLRIRIELCNYGHGHQYNCLAHHMFMSIISIPHDLKWFSSETSTQIKLIRSRNSLVFHTFPQTYVNLQFGFSWAKIHSRIIGVWWIMGVLLHVSCSKLPQKWWWLIGYTTSNNMWKFRISSNTFPFLLWMFGYSSHSWKKNIGCWMLTYRNL